MTISQSMGLLPGQLWKATYFGEDDPRLSHDVLQWCMQAHLFFGTELILARAKLCSDLEN